ncbi:IS4 family transposase, partial [Wolbachia endosymbiont of Cylisticus convexus]|uniref:IS4 family transposase n=1 Tax=Wolbachia endosymbiont of Cylisticus convexus TaxID=118728 RepID=UPI000DF6982E
MASEWAKNEFGDATLGDKRLTDRLANIADSLANMPESSINQACESWSEAKWAYRFFQNENVKESDILASHTTKTVERIKAHKKILVIQDTSCISYTGHKKTSGLGIISRKRSKGVMLHTAFAVSTEGLALGILDQKIYSRPPVSEEAKELKERNRKRAHIEDKESIKWLESLKKTDSIIDSTKTEAITVCDREADIYEFFELARNLNSAVLVRASKDRDINRKSRFSNDKQKLWKFVEDFSSIGTIEIEIPARDNKPKRTACLEVKFGKFMMDPPKRHIRYKEL